MNMVAKICFNFCKFGWQTNVLSKRKMNDVTSFHLFFTRFVVDMSNKNDNLSRQNLWNFECRQFLCLYYLVFMFTYPLPNQETCLKWWAWICPCGFQVLVQGSWQIKNGDFWVHRPYSSVWFFKWWYQSL